LERNNAKSIAYHFNLDRKSMQYFIGQSQWDDIPLRKEPVKQISQQLGETHVILILFFTRLLNAVPQQNL